MALQLLFFLFICLSLSQTSIAVDTISPGQTLTDNNQTLVSTNQAFRLGFFSPLNSTNRYIGIWFNNVPQLTPVWVANKNNPLRDSSGILTITRTGNILITNNQNIIIWSSNSSSTTATNPLLQLLNTGNLVVRMENSVNYTWQSFDYPCDTLIPGMKLGWDLRTNQEWFLTSWNSLRDPSSGEYTYRVDRRGLPQIILLQGRHIKYRSGPWDGVRFGTAEIERNPVFTPIFVVDQNNIYYSFENNGDSTVSRLVVSPSGRLNFISWSQTRNEWFDMTTLQQDNCDGNYGLCGPYGICNTNRGPACRCPTGFRPTLAQDWERFEWDGGCVRRIALNCSMPQGFRKFSGLKLPDSSIFLGNSSATNRLECREHCLRDCSCVAYAKTEISECVVWFGDLMDIKEYIEGGQDLYIRMDASELGSTSNAKQRAIITSVSVISVILLLGFITCYVFRKRAARRRRVLTAQSRDIQNQENNQSVEEEDLEVHLFDFVTISTATNNFSFTNKIGEGGFGPVYKGELSTGEPIAVKRLSKDSCQGLKEFKNEVVLYLKLQHRNLVRLLGCCIHGEGRMLIYEYMPNKSLDLIIFNKTRGSSLVWGERFDIIVGIARGLLYLHRDSRLRIIHRDLKASNILLDNEMNPKISDFGLAKTFRGDQSEENTNRIIGTYGYMSPEYAIDGVFSVKSDVFSFGVLVLEIVSGQKNRGFYHPGHDLNLLGHAWKLWNEGNPMKLLDACMESPMSTSEVIRCIQLGLLCVQQRPEDRPTMPSVLLMLDSENTVLAQPKQPGYYTDRFIDKHTSSSAEISASSNKVTVTLLQGR